MQSEIDSTQNHHAPRFGEEPNAEIAAIENEKLNANEVRKIIHFVNARLGELSPPLKRDLIRRLIVGVKLGKEQIEVALNPAALIAQVSENRPLKTQQANSADPNFSGSPVRLLSNLG